MQFAAVLALAASASAMVVQRQNETVATVEVYNFSTCDVDSVESFDFVTDSDCINFDIGYGSASFKSATDSNEYLLAVFTEKDCAGTVKVTGPTGCADNTSGEAIWSAGLVKNPAAKRA
ncbi:hypothetical protein SLS62_010106 [Diatrype stigma]|uniref:Uncharacterized protein n=1 Tax=Diatrype stigma TaxID=117547 RepID=A0AAN9UDN4_9PEZI